MAENQKIDIENRFNKAKINLKKVIGVTLY